MIKSLQFAVKYDMAILMIVDTYATPPEVKGRTFPCLWCGKPIPVENALRDVGAIHLCCTASHHRKFRRAAQGYGGRGAETLEKFFVVKLRESLGIAPRRKRLGTMNMVEVRHAFERWGHVGPWGYERSLEYVLTNNVVAACGISHWSTSSRFRDTAGTCRTSECLSMSG